MASKTFLLQILLTATNKASPILGKIANNYKQIGLAVAASGAAIAAFSAFAIKKASDLEESQSKFNTVFKQFAPIAEEQAKILQANFAMSEIAAKRNLSAVQDLLVPMGLVREEATKYSAKIVKLSADLGSFNNLPTEQVMLDIQSALVGNFETMKKYGVVLNATSVQQKILSDGVRQNKNEITQADKALAAYQLIVEGSGDAIGDMSRTFLSAANQSKFFRAQLDDIITTFGKSLLPVFTEVIILINRELLPAIKAFVENEEEMKIVTEVVSETVKVLISGLLLLVPVIQAVAKGWIALGAVMSGEFGTAKKLLESVGNDFKKFQEINSKVWKSNTDAMAKASQEMSDMSIGWSGFQNLMGVESDKASKKIQKNVSNTNKVIAESTESLNARMLRNAQNTASARQATEEAMLSSMLTRKYQAAAEDEAIANSRARTEEDVAMRVLGANQFLWQSLKEGYALAIQEIDENTLLWSERFKQVILDIHSSTSAAFDTFFKNVGKGWSAFSTLFTAIGDGIKNAIIKQISDIAATWLLKTASMAIATLAWKNKEVSANAAVAASKAAAASAWTLFGAIAIGLAVGAAVKGFAGKFQDGGIVGGNSFSGDNQLIRANSGEMVLNRGQQAQLFDMANGASASGGGRIVVNVNVSGNNILNEDNARGLVDIISMGVMNELKDMRLV